MLGSALLWLALTACSGRGAAPEDASSAGTPPRTDIKAPGNLPVRTEAELAEEARVREACVTECVRTRSMEAVAIEVIEASCQQRCLQEHPIEQVEVIPSPLAPIDLPE
jgi:hypothetical protein